MALAAALAIKQAKLKSVETRVTEAAPVSSGAHDLVSEWAQEQGIIGREALIKARNHFFDTNLDRITEALPAEAIIPSYSRKLTDIEIRALIGLWGNPSSTSLLLAEIDKFVHNQVALLGGGLVFVKLGSRSAKDVTWTHEKTLRLYREAVAARGGPSKVPTHDRLAMLYRALIDCLSVHSWAEALSLFLESTRVLFDLQLDLVVPSDLRTTVVVRPWLPLPLAAEWRAFMFGGRLRAISQYFTDLFFDDLAAQKDSVRLRILEFFEETVRSCLVDKLGLQEGVIDFIADPAGGPVRVLEVNQWAHSTGSGLFDWTTDHSLLTTSEDCPIRVRTEPVSLDRLNLPDEWRSLLTE